MLIVEDGRCPDNANSYVSYEQAEAYLAPRGLWPADTPEQDEAALMRAFDFLNGPLKWKGRKICWQRVCAWPRLDVPIPHSQPLEHLYPDEIPNDVLRAQMELAALIYKGSDLLAPLERGGRILSQSDSQTETVDVLSQSKSHAVTYAANAPVES